MVSDTGIRRHSGSRKALALVYTFQLTKARVGVKGNSEVCERDGHVGQRRRRPRPGQGRLCQRGDVHLGRRRGRSRARVQSAGELTPDNSIVEVCTFYQYSTEGGRRKVVERRDRGPLPSPPRGERRAEEACVQTGGQDQEAGMAHFVHRV